LPVDYQELGRRIARRRRELGLKQVDICERCDLSDKYLSAIERAHSIPSLDVLLRICEALDVTPNALLLGITHGDTDDIRDEIMQKARSLNAGQLRLLLSFVDWLSRQDIP